MLLYGSYISRPVRYRDRATANTSKTVSKIAGWYVAFWCEMNILFSSKVANHAPGKDTAVVNRSKTINALFLPVVLLY